jgi:hypothetical protein
MTVKNLRADKARLFECGGNDRQVRSPNEQVDVACVANRAFIDSRHPRGDGVSARDSVGNGYFIRAI